ncbi:MAG: hypothetical protein KDA49_10490 [Rhodospirillaceae bacterium]|nr:hypothetical protein [Rhodospirillaceae bacterium]
MSEPDPPSAAVDNELISRDIAARFGGERAICVGFPHWRAFNLRPFLSPWRRARFVADAAAAADLAPGPADSLIWWGCEVPAALDRLAVECRCRLLRIEDGFYRSVGLGSDYIPPLSLIFDASGLYLDARSTSDLEHILSTAEFTAAELARAAAVRRRIVDSGLTKYNLSLPGRCAWPATDRAVVLVVGQVEDDASILYGCDGVATNRALLEAARRDHPGALLVYKPHPEVEAGNRAGHLGGYGLADLVEHEAAIASCIEAADIVVTMTSLSGFEALLRGKLVEVHGRPFYAGWGLTRDRLAMPRRGRALSLDALVAGTLIRYPVYWDPLARRFTTVETVLERLCDKRDRLAARGRLHRLQTGDLARRIRKLRVVRARLAEALRR